MIRAAGISLVLLVLAVPEPWAQPAPEGPSPELRASLQAGRSSGQAVERSTAAGASNAAPAPLLPRRGDPSRLQHLLEEAGADTRAPGPPWSRYGRDLMRHLEPYLQRLLELSFGEPSPGSFAWLAWIPRLLLVSLGMILVWLGWRWWRGRERRTSRQTPGRGPAERGGGTPVEAGPGDTDWRARLEEDLAAGRLRQALEALWWWLALSLAGSGADPSWTGRELLRATGRRDLAEPVRRLEALAYGGRPVEADQVRALTGELEAKLVPEGEP